jgi:Leucine-rich repeat (LRR) protein
MSIFKANKIQTVPTAALNPNIRWLILTDNEIENIPIEILNASLIGAGFNTVIY